VPITVTSPEGYIAVPTARIKSKPKPGKTPLPYYRPHVLTDSINPPVTPAHGRDKLGLFLYKNGFSADPIGVLVSRNELCASADTMSGVLSHHGQCDGLCRIFLHNGW
jgi:hypothetical protein